MERTTMDGIINYLNTICKPTVYGKSSFQLCSDSEQPFFFFELTHGNVKLCFQYDSVTLTVLQSNSLPSNT